MIFTTQYLFALLPLLVVGLTVIIVMLGVAWQRNSVRSAVLTQIGLVAALASVCVSVQHTPLRILPLFAIDAFAVFYMVLVLLASIATAIFAQEWLKRYPDNKDEFYLLLLISTLGGLLLAIADHFAVLFLGVELLSLPVFGLVGYAYRRTRSLEASIKYMVLSATASSFLVFGIALLYAANGSLTFSSIGAELAQGPLSPTVQFVGLGLMLVGFGFKLSLAPFHIWTPDVYEGAPAPAAHFLATVGKIGVFCVLTRFLITAPLNAASPAVGFVLGLFSLLSIVFGNTLALRQQNVKRILGYSSISHLGYVLIALVIAQPALQASGSELNLFPSEAISVYLAGYLLSSMVAFGVVSLVSSPYGREDCDALDDYKGLFWRNPLYGFCLVIAMLSLAGIPLTLGFIGKFYIIELGVSHSAYWLVAAVVVGSAMGLYYYLRVVVAVFQQEGVEVQKVQEVKITEVGTGLGRGTLAAVPCASFVARVVLVVGTLLILILGIYPMPLINLAVAVFPAF